MSGYYKSWISEEEPKTPKGWGLATYRGKVSLSCRSCGKVLEVYKDEYLYMYTPEGVEIYHNSKECFG